MRGPIFNFLALAESIKILVSSCSHLILAFKDVSKKQTNKQTNNFNGLLFNIAANSSVKDLSRVKRFLVVLLKFTLCY